MGEHLQTCAVTNLPIREGDPVVSLFIARNEVVDAVRRGAFSPSFAYSPAGLPFHGVFNGAGVDDCERGNAMDVAVQMGLLSGNVIGKGVAHLSSGAECHAIMVHAEVWDRFSCSIRDRDGVEIGRADDVAAHDRLIDLWLTPLDSITPRSGLYGTPMLEHSWEEQGVDGLCPRAARLFSASSTCAVEEGFEDAVFEIVAKALQEGERDKARSVLIDCSRLIIMNEAMMALRKSWSPQVGLGSQDTGARLQKELISWMQTHVDLLLADELELSTNPNHGM